ncbi:MAG TPA: LuxR C-terminal-related transcriptional regulator [Chthoniobacterales bacterium]|nr:LuxR C-terminal-related transcriptional regulator [Chthoniobacterales bacterium]
MINQLTLRESSVLRLLAGGLSYKSIGETLDIGTETVRTHVRNARSKTGARSRLELVAKYLEWRPEAKADVSDVSLSPRELEVVLLLKGGRSDKAVAENLSIATGTVKTYLKSVYRKMGVRNRVQLMLRA